MKSYSMAKTDTLQCYNKACGVKFDSSKNTEDCCQHHPGVPVFHDALKGWSCCKKRTTDFSDFLKIPGCTRGRHNHVKPVEELKPTVVTKKEKSDNKEREFYGRTPNVPSPSKVEEFVEKRPSETDALQNLSVSMTSSYNQAKSDKISKKDSDEIKIGTACHNGGCKAAFTNSSQDNAICLHHPGSAVFHEGMKYWSCCQRKTSDFTSFLNQEGCSQGSHLWTKPKSDKICCRYDWHQTGKQVVLSIFAKLVNAKTSQFQANKVVCQTSLDFENGKHFDLHLVLFGVINPDKSKVIVSATKVEIILTKAFPMNWKSVGNVIEQEKVDDSAEQEKNSHENISTELETSHIEDDDSDLDGIDDVTFD